MAFPPPSDDGSEAPDLERLAEKWYAGAIKSGGLAAAISYVLKPIIGVVAGVLAFAFSILDPIALALAQSILSGFDTAASGPLETVTDIALAEYVSALGGEPGKAAHLSTGARNIATTFVQRIVDSGGTPTSEGITPSVTPAANLLAMMTELTVRGWALGLIGELETGGFIKAFEDLIGDISRTIGMGRLTRVALRPLIEAVVAAPAQHYIYAQYRPTLLSEGLAVKQVLRGVRDAAWLDNELGQAGYSPDRIAAILADARVHIGPADLFRLANVGLLSDVDVINELKTHGYLEGDAVLLRKADDIKRREQFAAIEIHDLLADVKAGDMTADEFGAAISAFPIPQADAVFWKDVATVITSHARRGFTLAQLKDLAKRNLITIDEYRDRLQRMGYSDEDATTLEQLELSVITDAAAAKSAKAATTAAKAATAAAAKQAKADAAAAKAAATAATRASAAQQIQTVRSTAETALTTKASATTAKLAKKAATIAGAVSAGSLTGTALELAQQQLAAGQAQHAALTTAHAATKAAADQAFSAIDASTVAARTRAAELAAATAKARARAELDQILLDAQRADRVAAFQASRDAAQAQYDQGTISATTLARKLSAIDLNEAKAIALEQHTTVAAVKAQAAAAAKILAGQVNVLSSNGSPGQAPGPIVSVADQAAAAVVDQVQLEAAAATAATAATVAATSARVQQLDAEQAQRDTLNNQLDAEQIQLETITGSS